MDDQTIETPVRNPDQTIETPVRNPDQTIETPVRNPDQTVETPEQKPAMEHIQDHGEQEEDKAPAEFLCCVCLEMIFKPVVLGCGHISCFWCTLKSMDASNVSRCAICRKTYTHFPRFCEMLNSLVLMRYPLEYKKRERQVREEEEKLGLSSPSTSDSQTDLQCAACKQLLFRPIVLNCGHVFCEACVDWCNSVYKCPQCESAHPEGFPNVCLVLEHYIQEKFPDEYTARKQCSPQSSRETKEPTSSSLPSSSGDGALFHAMVGCDNCGMCPIVGLRYKCMDCIEQIGFDLCENCFISSSEQPGRFNQRHNTEHTFEVFGLEADSGEQEAEVSTDNNEESDDASNDINENEDTDNESDDITSVFWAVDSLLTELRIIAYPSSSVDDSTDFESSTAPPNSNTHLED